MKLTNFMLLTNNRVLGQNVRYSELLVASVVVHRFARKTKVVKIYSIGNEISYRQWRAWRSIDTGKPIGSNIVEALSVQYALDSGEVNIVDCRGISDE